MLIDDFGVLSLVMIKCAVLLDDILIVLLLQQFSLRSLPLGELKFILHLLESFKQTRVVVSHGSIVLSQPVHFQIALMKLSFGALLLVL